MGGQTLDIVLKLQPDCLGLPLGALANFISCPPFALISILVDLISQAIAADVPPVGRALH